MPDILQDFPIAASPGRVFEAISTPEGLNHWWTETCEGRAAVGETYALGFGPDYQWQARVTQCEPDALFELSLTTSDADWETTRVTFELSPTNGGTDVKFAHVGWPAPNEHYRISSHCWALYLRLLRRFVEHGETVPYAVRLDA